MYLSDNLYFFQKNVHLNNNSNVLDEIQNVSEDYTVSHIRREETASVYIYYYHYDFHYIKHISPIIICLIFFKV